jgi:hypothetical protein
MLREVCAAWSIRTGYMAPTAGGDATSTTAWLYLPRQTEEDLWLDTSQIDFHRVGKIPGDTTARLCG